MPCIGEQAHGVVDEAKDSFHHYVDNVDRDTDYKGFVEGIYIQVVMMVMSMSGMSVFMVMVMVMLRNVFMFGVDTV